MNILGLTHPMAWNNAACLVVGGDLVRMIEEERLNRFKFSSRVPPRLSIEACLAAGDATLDDVDLIAVGWEAGNRQKRKKRFPWNFLARLLPFDIEDPRIRFVRHHLSHAIASYYLSGYPQANVISLDAYGGSESGVLGVGDGAEFRILKTVPTKGSWGWIYSEVTKALGFRFHADEGKVMGLASYGEPDMEGVDFVDWDRDVPLIDRTRFRRFAAELPRRRKGEEIVDDHRRAAATIQAVLGRGVRRMAAYLHGVSGFEALCLSGGCALNCAVNGEILREPTVARLYINPAPHDLSSAVGAALWAHKEATGERPVEVLHHAHLGPAYTDEAVEAVLVDVGVASWRKAEDICDEAARRLAEGEVVGWFQGPMEFGPRALGGRSILADPRDPALADRVNAIKGREPWRPLAPSIQEEEAPRLFDDWCPSPFMLIAFQANDTCRSEIPGVVHVDGSVRAQTVSRETQPGFHSLLGAFRERTGVGALLNTSFNVAREPIVCTPRDALMTFYSSGLDALVLGRWLVEKQPR